MLFGCVSDMIGLLQKKDGNMKVYSAYKPMVLDVEADAAPSALEKSTAPASGRQEKSKVILQLYL